MFSSAFVRRPASNIANGLTTAKLGAPDWQRAREQHQQYIEALQSCGLTVHMLPTLEDYPDSVFVEDIALLAPECAIITRPGAVSRRGETKGMESQLAPYFGHICHIETPGTIEAGDIMMVAQCFYIGLSARTNRAGAEQMQEHLEAAGLQASILEMPEVLHLKTGLSYLENGVLVASEAFIDKPEFASFRRIAVKPEENYAANCVWINGTVLLPRGYPSLQQEIESLGYQTIVLDMSEFQKLDGGLSCLSLRF